MTTPSGPHLSRDRLAGITARTAHLLATSVYVGGRVMKQPDERLRRWRQLSVLTGVVLLATEARHSREWPRQGRGLSTFAHIGVLAPAHLSPFAARAAPLAALVIGSVGSHLPRSIRTWTFVGESSAGAPEVRASARGTHPTQG